MGVCMDGWVGGCGVFVVYVCVVCFVYSRASAFVSAPRQVFASVTESVRQMYTVASALRRHRLRLGQLTVRGRNVGFKFGGSADAKVTDPALLSPSQPCPAHRGKGVPFQLKKRPFFFV